MLYSISVKDSELPKNCCCRQVSERRMMSRTGLALQLGSCPCAAEKQVFGFEVKPTGFVKMLIIFSGLLQITRKYEG